MVDDGDVYWVGQGNLQRYPKDAGAVAPLGPQQVGPIALGKGVIYWVSNNVIRSCATPACTTTTDLTSNDQQNVRALAADDTFVYWVRGDGVHRCAVGGCAQNPTVVGRATTLTLTALALGAADVFFGSDNGVVARCSKTGCGVNPIVLSPGPGNVSAIALVAAALYWSNSGGSGGVKRLAR